MEHDDRVPAWLTHGCCFHADPKAVGRYDQELIVKLNSGSVNHDQILEWIKGNGKQVSLALGGKVPKTVEQVEPGDMVRFRRTSGAIQLARCYRLADHYFADGRRVFFCVSWEDPVRGALRRGIGEAEFIEVVPPLPSREYIHSVLLARSAEIQKEPGK